MRYRGYLLDLDGTVYRGERLLPGAAEAVGGLRARGARVLFLSNKPLEPAAAYARKLTRLGLPTEADEVLTSAGVLTDYLRRAAPGARLYVIGEPPLLAELEAAGFEVTDEPRRVDVVVIAFDRTFDYRKLTLALAAARHGARLVATNPDRTCPVEEGEIPDCAAMIGAVEGATGRRVETIVGKPSPLTVEAALARLGGLAPREVLLVGDRLETDVQMGIRAGIDTALVLTGVTGREAVAGSLWRPTYVLEHLGEVLRL
ncbi:MAG TPA: HAD-IIA family hydrolase [Thermodesulfobacteriota bacterium]|nr:HAD-IIA family hydrolase [Thermodesulfobacteriota bacterium]